MQDVMNPAQRAAGRVRECFIVTTNAPENKAAPDNFQLLGIVAAGVVADVERLRIQRLVSRFGMSEPMAALVAGLAFGEGRQ